ncbi:hypothetical protein [Prevotella sp. HCN-7019]|uniref:hypothetical protein n=1 Tax=Prevotella sp. HCN-7019 TaxID=3134668 RepID=UPI0030BC340C
MKPKITRESPPTSSWVLAQYYSVIIISASIILLWIDTFIGILIIALAFLLVLPALTVSVISVFTSLPYNTHHKRILLIWHVVNILAFFLWLYNPNDKCDANIMEKHYLEYHAKMDDLYRNVYHQLKPGRGIYIEFENGKISIFHVSIKDMQGETGWDPSKEKVDSLLLLSGMDRTDLDYIENALDDIHCISISVTASPEKPYGIGFRRVLLDKYDYLIYPKTLSPEKQDTIGSDQGNILYSPRVVFRYNTGAIGNLNFPGKEEYLQSRKNAQCDN